MALSHTSRLAAFAWGLYRSLRTSRGLTRMMGYTGSVNHYKIEIDILHRCNVLCCNCSRSCAQAPAELLMTPDQIRGFVDESLASGRQWKKIKICGGEPALHPQLFEILEILCQYRERHLPDTPIEMDSAGYGGQVKKVLSRIPSGVNIVNSRKTPVSRPLFVPVNDAPVDSLSGRHLDFRNGCFIPQYTMGLNANGYYPCIVAGAIDRVFGLDMARKNLPPIDDEMRDLMNEFCPFCGCFRHFYLTDKQTSSISWHRAFTSYNRRPPEMTRVYG